MSKPTIPTTNARRPRRARRAAMAALIAAPVLLGTQAVAAPAAAQTVCGAHDEIISALARVNAEAPVAIGLSADGTLIELLVSQSGDWTILVTFPTRETCLLAAGEYWESIPVAAARADS